MSERQSPSRLPLTRSSEHYAVALEMLQQTRRSVHILSRRLDGKLYDTRQFTERIASLIAHQPRIRLRLLLREVEPLVKQGHRLIELSRRLTSAIEIRILHPDFQQWNEAFMVFDERRIIYRKLADRYEGFASEDPDLARQLLTSFTEAWDMSHSDPNLRRLYL